MRDSLRLIKSLLLGEAYLGVALSALQGLPERHKFFLPTAEAVCERLNGPIRVLEIGSWAGASAITWVKAFLKLGRDVKIDCVDQWVPYFDLSLETNPHYRRMNEAAATQEIYALFWHNLRAEGIDDRVSVHRGRSQDVLPGLPAESYHLIYIDGSHLYSDVVTDIREAKRLVQDGCIICGDDLELQRKEVPADELREAVESRVDYTTLRGGNRFFHPGVTAAVAEELGPVSAWQGFWAIRWDRNKTKKIKLDTAAADLPEHIRHAVEASPRLRFIEEDGSFRILELDMRYVAVAKHLDPAKIVDSIPPDIDISPVVFFATSIAELKRKFMTDSTESAKISADFQALSRKVDELSTELGLVRFGPTGHPESPALVGEYLGYNLVRLRGRGYGVRQSLGVVDLTVGDDILRARYGPDDLLILGSIDAVIAKIDNQNISRKIEEISREMSQLQGTLSERLGQGEAHIEKLQDRLGKADGRFASLETAHADELYRLVERWQAESTGLRDQIGQSYAELDRSLQAAVGELGQRLDRANARADERLEEQAEGTRQIHETIGKLREQVTQADAGLAQQLQKSVGELGLRLDRADANAAQGLKEQAEDARQIHETIENLREQVRRADAEMVQQLENAIGALSARLDRTEASAETRLEEQAEGARRIRETIETLRRQLDNVEAQFTTLEASRLYRMIRNMAERARQKSK